MMWLDGRRLGRALALGALSFLLLGGGIGFALADGKDGPASAAMKPATAGDSATYQMVEFHVGEAQGAYSGFDLLQFSWLEERWIPDADLNLRLVHPLLVHAEDEDFVTEREILYDAATGEPILNGGHGPWYASEPIHGLAGLYTVRPDESLWYDMYGSWGGPCGVRNALQDEQSVSKPLLITGYCDYLDGQANLTYHFVGQERIGDHLTYHFQDRTAPQFEGWYAPDVPFPVAFTSTMSDLVNTDFLGHERMYRLELTSFTPGTGHYTHPDEPVLAPGPGLPAQSPRTNLLLDFQDFPSPFPFPDAYAAAAADTGEDGLAEFLAQHPRAYPAEANQLTFTDENGGRHESWYFVVTDGTAAASRHVRRGPPDGTVVWLPDALGQEVSIYQWDYPDAQKAGRYPTPDRLPSQFPRPADVLALDAFVQVNQPTDAHYLGWRVRCLTPVCADPDVMIRAGHQDIQYNWAAAPLVLPSGRDSVVAYFWVDGDGRAGGRYSFISERPYFAVPGTAPLDTERAGPEPLGAGMVPAWHGPGQAAVAGVSMFALLASALYYLWPNLKGLLGVGMFSRIQDDKLLDHPRRAQVLQLVQAEPGIHFRDMTRRLNFGRGTLEHHLRKMIAAGILTKVVNGGYACYFPKGAVDRRVMNAAPVLRSGGGRSVFDAVRAQPGQSSRQIAAALGLAPSTVSYHLKKLEEAGLVFSAASTAGGNGGAGLRLSPLGEQAAT